MGHNDPRRGFEKNIFEKLKPAQRRGKRDFLFVKSLQNFTLLAFCLHSVCDIFKLQKPGGKAWLFLYPEKKEGGPHEEHQKRERGRKALRRLRMARQENGNTPLRTAALHIRETRTPAGQGETLWRSITRIRGPLYGFCS